MKSPLALRPARRTDALGIARVHVETWRNTYAGMVPEAYLLEMSESRQAIVWQRNLDNLEDKDMVLVAEAGEEIVGFANFGLTRSPDLPYEGEVYALYVTVDWQGQGVGRDLVTGAFECFQEFGIDSALVWVLAENPSRFFYESLKGQRIAQRQESFVGQTLNELAYGWRDIEGWLNGR